MNHEEYQASTGGRGIPHRRNFRAMRQWAMYLLPIAVLTVTGSSLVSLLISILAVGLICWLLLWLISYIGVPDPFAKVARAIVAVIAVIFLINIILGLSGHAIVAVN